MTAPPLLVKPCGGIRTLSHERKASAMFLLRMVALVGLTLSLGACWEPVNRGTPGVFTKITACGRGAEYVKAAKAAGEAIDCAGQGEGAAPAHH